MCDNPAYAAITEALTAVGLIGQRSNPSQLIRFDTARSGVAEPRQ
jgi:hypothetical protein